MKLQQHYLTLPFMSLLTGECGERNVLGGSHTCLGRTEWTRRWLLCTGRRQRVAFLTSNLLTCFFGRLCIFIEAFDFKLRPIGVI